MKLTTIGHFTRRAHPRGEIDCQERLSHNKHRLFPNEGGPAILEVSVPAWIMAIVYADPIAAGLARSGEIRFDRESGLKELRAEWHNLTKRVIPL
jgi:hypothetical protein